MPLSLRLAALLTFPLTMPGTAFAEAPQPMADCEPGAAVTVPGFLSTGIITDQKSGMCVIDMGGGNITVMPAALLTRAAAPATAPVATEGPAALIEGYWTCRFADGTDSFDLYLTPGRYDTMEGSTGELLPYDGDPLAVRFVGGPYDGLFGTVSNSSLWFQPPGAGSAACTFRP